MSPRERLLRTLRGWPPDHVPLVLEGFHCAHKDQIQSIPDPARREIARRIFGQTAAFVHCPSFENRYLFTPRQFMKEVSREQTRDAVRITTRIATPKGDLTAVTARNSQSDTVWTIKYPVESLQDVEKIRCVPWELPEGLAGPDTSKLPADFHRRLVLRTNVSSPFVCVAGMMPYDYFLELCATDLGLIEELTEQCCDRALRVLDVLLADEAIEYVWMGGCEWLTPPMGSPRLYERLVQPYEAKVISRIHAAGAIAHVHCHGNVRSTLELVIRRGGDYFEPVEPPPDGDISFAEAKALAAGRITLGGNVEARILENESAKAVERATRAAFEGGKHRMVLSNSAGPISPLTPRALANYHRLIDVWEELSPL
ncbi:MAG: hypothetical protein AMJ81_05185 [Phycisphaerae bacterium SM23_33]|nr:MAG: hypothetical protein AMJ81_05185 [Phycisphaerae bacterium SM23_33]